MKEKHKLTACPFCGHVPEVITVGGYSDWWEVRCSNFNCKVMPTTDGCMTIDQAIEAWSEREK